MVAEKLKIENRKKGISVLLSPDEYEVVAAYVREQDQIFHAKLVMQTYCQENKDANRNTVNYVFNSPETLREFIEKLDIFCSENPGKNVNGFVNEFLQSLNTSIYTVKSKVGTNFEEQNEVEMPMMEAYDILMNIEYPTREKITDVLYTINGKEISVKNISSIRYNRRTREMC